MNSFAELPCAEKGTWLRRHTSYIRFVGGVLLRSAQPRGQWSRASQPIILASWRNWKSPIATLRSQCLSGTQDFLGPSIRKSEETAQAHQCEIHSDVGGADACFGKQHLTARAVADAVYGCLWCDTGWQPPGIRHYPAELFASRNTWRSCDECHSSAEKSLTELLS